MTKLKVPKRIRNHVNPLAYEDEMSFSGFGNKSPIIVDIGSYRGEFGAKLVDKFESENEKRNFIFFEIRKPFVKYLKQLFEGRENVKIFGGNAGKNLENILKPSIEKGVKIEKIFINFPDPWFKKKHYKRRVITAEFLEDLQKWLPTETDIIFQTDQKKLFKWTEKVVRKNGFFKIEKFKKPIWGITTYWEDMKVKEKNKIWRMKISRSEKRIKRFWIF